MSLSSHNEKNRSVFWVQILELGGKKIPPKLAPVVDSEFDVDYDFAIKQDPIQSDD